MRDAIHVEHPVWVNSEELIEDYRLSCDCPVYETPLHPDDLGFYKTREPRTDAEREAVKKYMTDDRLAAYSDWDSDGDESPPPFDPPTFYECAATPCFSQACEADAIDPRYAGDGVADSCWKVGVKFPNLVFEKGAVKPGNTFAYNWPLRELARAGAPDHNKSFADDTEIRLSYILKVINEKVYSAYEKIAKKAGLAPVPEETFTWAININICRSGMTDVGEGAEQRRNYDHAQLQKKLEKEIVRLDKLGKGDSSVRAMRSAFKSKRKKEDSGHPTLLRAPPPPPDRRPLLAKYHEHVADAAVRAARQDAPPPPSPARWAPSALRRYAAMRAAREDAPLGGGGGGRGRKSMRRRRRSRRRRTRRKRRRGRRTRRRRRKTQRRRRRR